MHIKDTWTVQNFPLVILVALYVAVFLNINPIEFTATTIAYEKEVTEEVDIATLLEKYEQEETIKAEREIKFRAIKRIYDELGVIVDYEQEGRVTE